MHTFCALGRSPVRRSFVASRATHIARAAKSRAPSGGELIGGQCESAECDRKCQRSKPIDASMAREWNILITLLKYVCCSLNQRFVKITSRRLERRRTGSEQRRTQRTFNRVASNRRANYFFVLHFAVRPALRPSSRILDSISVCEPKRKFVAERFGISLYNHRHLVTVDKHSCGPFLGIHFYRRAASSGARNIPSVNKFSQATA